MIVLTTGTTNTVCLTLSDSATIDNPYFVFRFVDAAGASKVFYAPDTAIGNRCNVFDITLSETENLTGGTVDWVSNDDPVYYVYQASASGVTSITSPYLQPLCAGTTFDPDFDFLEVGRMYVVKSDEITNTVYTDGDSTETIIYR